MVQVVAAGFLPAMHHRPGGENGAGRSRRFSTCDASSTRQWACAGSKPAPTCRGDPPVAAGFLPAMHHRPSGGHVQVVAAGFLPAMHHRPGSGRRAGSKPAPTCRGDAPVAAGFLPAMHHRPGGENGAGRSRRFFTCDASSTRRWACAGRKTCTYVSKRRPRSRRFSTSTVRL